MNPRRILVALTAFMLLAASQFAAGQDKAKDKDAKDKKEPAKEVKGTAVKVVKLDRDKRTAVVQGSDGNLATIKIGDDVQFIGPRGGVSKEGIKDDRFAVGAEVRLVMGDGKKTVKEVHLPVRKGEDKDKKDGKDKKDK